MISDNVNVITISAYRAEMTCMYICRYQDHKCHYETSC